MRSLSLVVFLAGLSTSVQAWATFGPVADLNIVNARIEPDGHSRLATLVDRDFPGPLIQANKGDNFALNVINHLQDPSLDLVTSIHWHGISQKTTNYIDGAAFVTQCPIIPKNSFLYKFNALQQAGTYWYHSHLNAQSCDGLRGALVIYDPKDPQRGLYDVDNADTVITLADWYHYSSVGAPLVPKFNSTLINGKGRHLGGPKVPLAVVNVDRGVRYRLRIVSISCDPAFAFSIDGHQLTVIEVDGNNVQPLVVDSLRIFAGQRYSVVLIANQPINNYWIRALPDSVNQKFTGSTNLAILRYKGARPTDPTNDPTVNIPTSVLPLIENNLHPLDVPKNPVPGLPFPGGADINVNLAVKLSPDSTKYLVNGFTFEPPKVPVLLQILSGAQSASDLVPEGSMYGLEPNKSVEISIPGGVAGGHPIHLHGHSFHVVRSAGSSTYNYVNPVIRDVVDIGGAGDNMTIRFYTDNPGPWFLHSQNNWDLVKGFAVVLAEDVPEVPTKDVIDNPWKTLCPAYNSFVNP